MQPNDQMPQQPGEAADFFAIAIRHPVISAATVTIGFLLYQMSAKHHLLNPIRRRRRR